MGGNWRAGTGWFMGAGGLVDMETLGFVSVFGGITLIGPVKHCSLPLGVARHFAVMVTGFDVDGARFWSPL